MSKQQSKSDLAVGIKRTPGGWTLIRYQIKDGKVVAEKRTEPDTKSLTLEHLQQAMFDFYEVEG